MRKPEAAEAVIHFYTPQEEFLNAVTHGFGSLAVIAGVIALIIFAGSAGTPAISAVSIYGFTLLAMYLSSTLYHAVTNDRWKLFFRRLDYCSIYLLIAGTYTPLMLLAVGGAWGRGILIAVWSLAAIGITIKCFTMKECGGLSLYLYLIMGWLCLLCIRTLFCGMSTPAIALLITGGAFYTAGIFFFTSNRPYRHAVWHFFVLGGTISHFLMVWLLL